MKKLKQTKSATYSRLRNRKMRQDPVFCEKERQRHRDRVENDKEYKIKRKTQRQVWQENNKEHLNELSREYRKNNPWKGRFYDIKQRCNNPKNKRYHRYGKRGIKCLITENEIRELWFRDKAYLMERPSIDRENNDGNYTFENCRFIELSLNSKLGILNSQKEGKI